MKEKKNIIKRKSLSNKKFFINYKREIKYLLKKKNFKFKKFNNLLIIFYSLKKILNVYKQIKLNIYRTKNNLLLKKYVYFNFITNGLDLKYDNQIQNLTNNNIYISNFLIKNTIIMKNNNIDIVKLQKFLTLISNNFIDNIKNEDSTIDYFIINNLIFVNYIKEIYINIYTNILLKLIY